MVLGSTSTSTTTVAASTVGYGGDHTMGVGGGGPGTCNAHPYIYQSHGSYGYHISSMLVGFSSHTLAFLIDFYGMNSLPTFSPCIEIHVYILVYIQNAHISWMSGYLLST